MKPLRSILRSCRLRTLAPSPWQNGFAGSWIGSLRSDRLDPGLAIHECQLRTVIRSYVGCDPDDRTHLGLEKDVPEERLIEPSEIGDIVAIARDKVTWDHVANATLSGRCSRNAWSPQCLGTEQGS